MLRRGSFNRFSWDGAEAGYYPCLENDCDNLGDAVSVPGLQTFWLPTRSLALQFQATRSFTHTAARRMDTSFSGPLFDDLRVGSLYMSLPAYCASLLVALAAATMYLHGRHVRSAVKVARAGRGFCLAAVLALVAFGLYQSQLIKHEYSGDAYVPERTTQPTRDFGYALPGWNQGVLVG